MHKIALVRPMRRAAAVAILALALHPRGAVCAQSGVAQLSTREQSERIRLLPDEERRWFDFVRPILLPDERNFFLLLTEPHQREIFREEFWERREREGLAPPLGPGYRVRYEELLRRANEAYDGWRQDAGRMVIAHGEPAGIEVVEGCDNLFRHLEIWTYSDPLPGFHGARHYFFSSIAPLVPRKLWSIGDPDSDIFQPLSCRKSLEDLRLDCVPQPGDPCGFSNCPGACHVYEIYLEIKLRQSSATSGHIENARLLAPPAVPTEQLFELAARFPGIGDPRAKPLRVESGFSAAPTPQARHRLTSEEIFERLLSLAPRYRAWLDLAAPLMTTSDLDTFLQLTSGEKDQFIREFFRSRS